MPAFTMPSAMRFLWPPRGAGPKGTGSFRLDFNAAARTITVFMGTTPGGPWYGTTMTTSLDTLPLPPFAMSSLRVGLWGRQWTAQVS